MEAFYMCMVDGMDTPKKRHGYQKDSEIEAERLSRLNPGRRVLYF
jgi:hypothetical protein